MTMSKLPAVLLATTITDVMASGPDGGGVANGKMAILPSVESVSFPCSRRTYRLLASMSSSTKSRMMPASNKAAFKRGTNFLAFIQMHFDGKENERGTNRSEHHEINDKGNDKISIIPSISLRFVMVWVLDDKRIFIVILGERIACCILVKKPNL